MDGDPLHAENAMRMSWRMVQVARDMDVPIRIGVHTGALMSGIISRNAPFDVWGGNVLLCLMFLGTRCLPFLVWHLEGHNL